MIRNEQDRELVLSQLRVVCDAIVACAAFKRSGSYDVPDALTRIVDTIRREVEAYDHMDSDFKEIVIRVTAAMPNTEMSVEDCVYVSRVLVIDRDEPEFARVVVHRNPSGGYHLRAADRPPLTKSVATIDDVVREVVAFLEST